MPCIGHSVQNRDSNAVVTVAARRKRNKEPPCSWARTNTAGADSSNSVPVLVRLAISGFILIRQDLDNAAAAGALLVSAGIGLPPQPELYEHSQKMERLLNILVTFTLIEMMVAIGLSVTVADLLMAARSWRLFVRALLANYVCVPAAVIVLLLLVDPHPMVAAGFLVLAVCPGAPYGPPLTVVAKGNAPLAIGWMALLAGSSAIIAPLALRGLLPLVSANDPPVIASSQMAITLLLTQLVPLSLGIATRHWRPTVAVRMQQPANLLSKVLNLLTIGLILFTQFDLLAEIRPRGFIGMAILLAVSWTAGWLFGGPAAGTRKALAVTTSLRNFGVGLVIATNSFSNTPAVTAITAYGIMSLFTTIGLAMLARRLTARGDRLPPDG
jgi:bile acid:Na+ symporter, BASS family